MQSDRVRTCVGERERRVFLLFWLRVGVVEMLFDDDDDDRRKRRGQKYHCDPGARCIVTSLAAAPRNEVFKCNTRSGGRLDIGYRTLCPNAAARDGGETTMLMHNK